MSNRVLGIEYADDRIKVVEVSFGRRLKIYNFAVIDNRNVDPARRAQQFSHTLQVRGFEAKDAVIAASGGHIEHRLLTLPPLSARELHFVMQREARKIAPTGGNEALWSYDIVKTKEELGIKKNQILLVTADKSVGANAQSFAAQTRLKLQQLTTVPESLLSLHRQSGAWKKDSVRTLVHFNGNLLQIIFTQDGVLLLSREIRFDSSLAMDEQINRLVNELRRSLLYFRQNFPQSQIGDVVLSGDNDSLGTLATRASEELGVSAAIGRFDDNIDTTAFRGNFDELRFQLPALAAALGAAWRKSPGATGINLLPGKNQPKQIGANPTRLAKMACAAALAAALITGVYYAKERGGIDMVAQDASQRLAIVDPQLRQAAELEVTRAEARERAVFLSAISTDVDWMEILRRLSFVIPATGVFDEIDAERTADSTVLTIRGRLLAATAVQANSDFARFFSNIRSFPFFDNVTMPHPVIVSFEDAAASPASVSTFNRRSKVEFEIQCHLR